MQTLVSAGGEGAMRTFVVPGAIAESLGFANTGEEGVGVETPRMEMVAVATPFLPFLVFR